MPHLYEFFAVLYNLCRFCLAALLRAYDISPLVHIRTGSVLRVTVLRGVINTFSVWDGGPIIGQRHQSVDLTGLVLLNLATSNSLMLSHSHTMLQPGALDLK